MSRSIRINSGYTSVAMPDGKMYDGQTTITLTDAQYLALGPNVFTSGLLTDLGAVADPAIDASFATDAALAGEASTARAAESAEAATARAAEAAAAPLVHAARHAPGGADPLDAYYAGRVIAYVDSTATFTFDGTGGQTAATFADVPGLVTPVFAVNAKPIRLRIEGSWILRNGTTKFTGNGFIFANLVCVTAPTPGDVGLEVMRWAHKFDRPTASNGAVSTAFEGDNFVRSRLLTVGNGGLIAGQIAAGAGYTFKMQMTLSTVTNVAGLIQVPNSGPNTPAALIEVSEA